MDHVFLRPKERETPNLTANHGPKSFEGPSKRENLTANYVPIFFEGPSKKENQKP